MLFGGKVHMGIQDDVIVAVRVDWPCTTGPDTDCWKEAADWAVELKLMKSYKASNQASMHSH